MDLEWKEIGEVLATIWLVVLCILIIVRLAQDVKQTHYENEILKHKIERNTNG